MASRTKERDVKKVKVGTILDEDIFKRLKALSLKEGRSIGAMIEQAVMKYEQEEATARDLRVRALESVFALNFNISDDDLRQIMEEDYYDQ